MEPKDVRHLKKILKQCSVASAILAKKDISELDCDTLVRLCLQASNRETTLTFLKSDQRLKAYAAEMKSRWFSRGLINLDIPGLRRHNSGACSDCTQGTEDCLCVNMALTAGFSFEDDKRPRLNANMFANHVNNYISTFVDSLNTRWLYVDRYYVPWKTAESTIKSYLFNMVNGLVENSWSTAMEGQYLAAIERLSGYQTTPKMGANLINFTNGLLNPFKGILRPHTPDIITTVQVPTAYDPQADCPAFMAFLDRTFAGNQDLIDLVSEIFGYCLTMKTSAQRFFVLYGSGGNGKSTLLWALQEMVGVPNCSFLRMSDLNGAFRRREMVGKLVNSNSEEAVRFHPTATAILKAISAGDPIQVDVKGKLGFAVQLYAKLIFAVNQPILFGDTSEGLWRRIVIIPFLETFSDEHPGYVPEDQLKRALQAELSGIVNFALSGLNRLKANDWQFTIPDICIRMLDEWKSLTNPLEAFVKNCIIGSDTERTPNSVLHQAFDRYCDINGLVPPAMSPVRFSSDIRRELKRQSIEFDLYSSASVRGLKGISLKGEINGTRSGNTTKQKLKI